MSTLKLASRLDVIKPSATIAVAQKARELSAAGKDVLSFSLGEPDFPTPESICEAAHTAIRAGATHYTTARGVQELREVIVETSAKRRGGVRHRPEEVVVTVGAKHALFNLALALYGPGDEVIIPAPYWVSYPEQVRLVGATAVIAETTEEQGFRLQPETLRAAITDRTRALILCTPSNPTGSAYDADSLKALLEVCAEHDFWIIVDEIYGELIYGGFEKRPALELAPELKDRMVVVDGVSKTYAMTGWRIGWLLAPTQVANACDTLQSQSTSNPTAVAQYAALAALTGPQEPVAEMCAAFERRRDLIIGRINAIDGLHARMPEGAFYAFVDARALVGRHAAGERIESDVDLAGYLLDEACCALVPGTAFGAPGYLRMSYATSEDQIETGMARIAAAVAKLS